MPMVAVAVFIVADGVAWEESVSAVADGARLGVIGPRRDGVPEPPSGDLASQPLVLRRRVGLRRPIGSQTLSSHPVMRPVGTPETKKPCKLSIELANSL